LHRWLENGFIELPASEVASNGDGVEDVEVVSRTPGDHCETTGGGGRVGHHAIERI
jgi:hypothetical protein